MSFVSQLIIVIIHYASIFGLLISGLLSLILPDKRKKMLFLFISFLFAGILSFVYYSAILFFIVGILMVLFFLSLYLFVLQIEIFGNKTGPDENKKLNGRAKNILLNIIVPLLFCAAAVYFFYKYTVDFLRSVSGSGNIFIAGLGDISKQFFTDYSLILVIITASLLMSFLWFIIISKSEE